MLEALYKQIYFLLLEEPYYKEFLYSLIDELNELSKLYLHISQDDTSPYTSFVKMDDIDAATTDFLVTKTKSSDLFKLLFHNFTEGFDKFHEEGFDDWGTLSDDIDLKDDFGKIKTTLDNQFYSLERDIYESYGHIDDTEIEVIDLNKEVGLIDWSEESERTVFYRDIVVDEEITERRDYATYEAQSGKLLTEPETFKECLRRALRSSTHLQDVRGTSSSISHILYINGVGSIVQDLFCPIGFDDEETKRNYVNTSCWIASPDKRDLGVLGKTLTEVDKTNAIYVSNIDAFKEDDYVFHLSGSFNKNCIRKILYKDKNRIFLDDIITLPASAKLNVLRPTKWVSNPDPSKYFKVPYIDVTIIPTSLYNTRELLPVVKTLVLDAVPVNVCIRDIQLGGLENYEYFTIQSELSQVDVEYQQRLRLKHITEVSYEQKQYLKIKDSLDIATYEADMIVIDDSPQLQL